MRRKMCSTIKWRGEQKLLLWNFLWKKIHLKQNTSWKTFHSNRNFTERKQSHGGVIRNLENLTFVKNVLTTKKTASKNSLHTKTFKVSLHPMVLPILATIHITDSLMQFIIITLCQIYIQHHFILQSLKLCDQETWEYYCISFWTFHQTENLKKHCFPKSIHPPFQTNTSSLFRSSLV